MKKKYEKPTVEAVKFQYRDQVVATSLAPCGHYTNYDIAKPGCVDSGHWGRSAI